MAYDERLADRVRRALAARDDVSERKMFGGIAFMVAKGMAVGIVADDLMVRVGPDAWEDALARPHARPMDFTGKPMKGFVYVAAPGINTPRALATWVDRALVFVDGLATAPKPKRKPKRKLPKPRPKRSVAARK
jgi:TfoX/Sxy family transcriptional regulator of competence genes